MDEKPEYKLIILQIINTNVSIGNVESKWNNFIKHKYEKFIDKITNIQYN
jgi:hypothetical protein